MKKNKRLFAPGSPSATPSKKEGIRSWLKIQVESEGYQPPRGGVVLLQVLVGLLFFVFVVRFWYLQVHRGEEFARQAQENRLRQERIFAPRGRILDDGDKLLADNRTAYGLSLVREDCHDIPATLAQISAWSGIPLPQIWEKYQQDRFKVKS
ncbi:MAG: penicillin-binding protein 2, partial [Desulfovibrio fairfieldensis]|nr:penicillin-binding protein 2 [Desulfovibrio fairfieldensis]